MKALVQALHQCFHILILTFLYQVVSAGTSAISNYERNHKNTRRIISNAPKHIFEIIKYKIIYHNGSC